MQRYEKARRWDRVVMSIRKLPHQAMNLCRSGPMRVPKPSGFAVGSADAAAKPQSKRSETMLEDIGVIIPCLVSCSFPVNLSMSQMLIVRACMYTCVACMCGKEDEQFFTDAQPVENPEAG